MRLTNGKLAILNSLQTPDDMQEEILSIGNLLVEANAVACTDTLIALAKMLPAEERKRLSRSLRSPMDAAGIMRDSPVWPEVEAAIKRNWQNDTGE